MRIGIMGGTLDPVHNGHMAIAEAVLRECALDRIMLLPAGDPPHKQRQIDRSDRLKMAQLAAESYPWMFVSDEEVLREGTTYTVDTIRTLNAGAPGTEWVYIIGADTLRVLHLWKDFAQVAAMCTFAVVDRPGVDRTSVMESAEKLKREFSAQIRLLDVQGPEISSTQIRDAVAQGKDVAQWLPAGVSEYIRKQGLYLCRYSWDKIDGMLRACLKPGRYEHTLGVVETAVRLSQRYGVDPQRARLAALLHDCAKPLDYGRAMELARNWEDVDEEELGMEPVLHAPAGAVMAQREFGVQDPEILSAIRCHTLGRKGMSALELLIFVSDFIEPGRKLFEGLEETRRLAEYDLKAAAGLSAELSGRFVVSRGGKIHPRTAEMLEEISFLKNS